MTALADTDYFEDEDYDGSRTSRYDEGFGHVHNAENDFDSGYDELDRMLDDLFVEDEDDDLDASAPKKSASRKSVTAKASTSARAEDTSTTKAAVRKVSKTAPKAGPVITRRLEPQPTAVSLPEAPTDDIDDADLADGAAVEAVTAVAVETAPEAEAPADKDAPEPAPSRPDSPFFAPHIAVVNEHVELLRKLRPGFEVPYVDPMHSADEARIVSLFSNNSEASPNGTVWAGDDAAATRLLGLQFQLGLRPEWLLPWNTHPWFTPGESNGKLTPEQVNAGLKPLLTLMRLLPRVSAIVAHGTEANRLAQMLLKTDNPLIWRRGLKVYKARSLHGRSFAGSKERQTEWLIDMGRSYADAMGRAGLQTGRR